MEGNSLYVRHTSVLKRNKESMAQPRSIALKTVELTTQVDQDQVWTHRAADMKPTVLITVSSLVGSSGK